MAGLVLNAGDRAYFLTLMRRQLNSAVHRRMNALLLLDGGWSTERIAEALFIEAETVRDHHRRYISDGRDGIERLAYVGSAPVLSTVQRAALEAALGARLYMSAQEVCDGVARQFGLTYTPPRSRQPNLFPQEHADRHERGGPKGAERIASRWADTRKVPQVAFKSDWARHTKAAPCKRNDQILATPPIGGIVFPVSGIQDTPHRQGPQDGHPHLAALRAGAHQGERRAGGNYTPSGSLDRIASLRSKCRPSTTNVPSPTAWISLFSLRAPSI